MVNAVGTKLFKLNDKIFQLFAVFSIILFQQSEFVRQLQNFVIRILKVYYLNSLLNIVKVKVKCLKQLNILNVMILLTKFAYN